MTHAKIIFFLTSPSMRRVALTFAAPFFLGLSPFSNFCFSKYRLSTVVLIFLMFVDATENGLKFLIKLNQLRLSI